MTYPTDLELVEFRERYGQAKLGDLPAAAAEMGVTVTDPCSIAFVHEREEAAQVGAGLSARMGWTVHGPTLTSQGWTLIYTAADEQSLVQRQQDGMLRAQGAA